MSNTTFQHRPLSLLMIPYSDAQLIAGMDSLVESIRRQGLLRAIDVIEVVSKRPRGSPTYYIVDGVSRMFAYRIAYPRALDIPCAVRKQNTLKAPVRVFVAEYRACQSYTYDRMSVVETVHYLTKFGLL